MTTVVHASSWDPTLLVNTEAFTIIDDGDGASNISIQFGDALSETLSFNVTSGQFDFSDDLNILGDLNVTGSMSGERLHVSGTGATPVLATDSTTEHVGIGTVTPEADLEIFRDGIPEQYLTGFNNSGGGQIIFRRARGTSDSPGALEFGNAIGGVVGAGRGTSGFSGNRASISFHAAEDWSDTEQGTEIRFQVTQSGGTTGLEPVRITGDGNVGVNQNDPEAQLDVAGTISGSTLTTSSLKNCDTTDTDADGNFVCGTDAMRTISELDDRYVEQAGDTMTGALVIDRTGGTELIRLHDDTSGDSVSMFTGAGSPEGVVTAQLGSLYFDNFRGITYKKHDGDGTNTGWEELAISTGAHIARMTRAAAQTLLATTQAQVNFDTITFDDGGLASTTTDDFTIRNTGSYLVTAAWTTTADLDNNEYAEVCIFRNGLEHACQRNESPGGNNIISVNISDVLQLNQNDTIEMFIEQQDDSLDTNTASFETYMAVTEIGAAGGGGGGGGGGITIGEADDRYVNTTGDTMSGTLTLEMNSNNRALDVDSMATGEAAIRVDIAGDSDSPHVLFGSGGTFDTNLFRSAANTLRTSDSFIIDTSLGIGTTSAPSTELEVVGTMSGYALTVSDLKNCDTIDTDANGNVSCGTDTGFTTSAADDRFVNQAGDTMTGTLVLDQDSNTDALQVDSEATSQPAVELDIAGDSDSPHLSFGEAGTFDTNLYRQAANVLRTDDAFHAGGALSGASLSINNDVTIAADGTTVFNEDGSQADFRIESDNQENALFVDSASDQIGVSTNAPEARLDVAGSVSGSSLTVSNLKECQSIETNLNGQLVCSAQSSSGSFISITTTEDSNASAALFDIFEDANYPGTLDSTTNASENVTFTSSNGRFTISATGSYFINLNLLLEKSSGSNESAYDYFVLVNGSTLYQHEVDINANLSPTEVSLALIRNLGPGDYVEFAVDSQTADTATIHDGTTATFLTIEGAGSGGGGGGGGGLETFDDIYDNDLGERTIVVDDGSVSWDLSGAHDFIIDLQGGGNVGIDTDDPTADLEVAGTMSGHSLTLSDLPDCDTIDTDASGNLACGTDELRTLSELDDRYVNQSGDTMTGTLLVNQDSNADAIRIDSEATSQPGLEIDIAGDSNSPHVLFGEGGVFDTNLFRQAANVLRTDDSFWIGGTLSGATLSVAGGIATIDASDSIFRNAVSGVTLSVAGGATTVDTSGNMITAGNVAMSGALTVEGTAIFNEDEDTSNLRVASDNETNMFFVDGTNDRIGIKTGSPDAPVDIEQTGEVVELGNGTAADSYLNFDDGTDRNFGWDDSENSLSTFDQQLRFRTRQSAAPPVACSATVAGMQWMDTDTGQLYICDTSNGRNKWLSTFDLSVWGEQNGGNCASGDDISNEEDCAVDFGGSLGGHNNTTDNGFYVARDITITGYGFSQDEPNCDAGTMDIEVWTSASGAVDEPVTLTQTLTTLGDVEVGNSTTLNVDIDGDRYMLWGIDNNCGGNAIDDFNMVLYYRWRHD